MVLTKKELLDIAREMGLRGVTKMTKHELVDTIVKNPCTSTTQEECEELEWPELRMTARRCGVLLGKKRTRDVICTEIVSKFANKAKTLADLGGQQVYNKAVGTGKTKKQKQKSLVKDTVAAGSPTYQPGSRSALQTPGAEILVRRSPSPIPPKSQHDKNVSTLHTGSKGMKPVSSQAVSNGRSVISTRKKSPKLGDDYVSMKSKGKSGLTSASARKLPRKEFSGRSGSTTNTSPSALKTENAAVGGGDSASDALPTPVEVVTTANDTTPERIATALLEGSGGDDLSLLKNGRNAPFLDAIDLHKPGASAYTTETCNIDVMNIKNLASVQGMSGSSIYSAVTKTDKAIKVIVKLWKYCGTHKANLKIKMQCLRFEWNMYAYIVPYIFFSNITPCILVPARSGICSKSQLDKEMQNDLRKNDMVQYTVTPYIEKSLAQMYRDPKYGPQLDMRNIMFQLVYTVNAFAGIGIRHNDAHTNNIRVVSHPSNPFRICFKLDNVSVYSLIPFLIVFNDFDRTGISPDAVKAMGGDPNLVNPCATAPKGYYCNGLNQCDTPDGGARDLLTLAFYLFNVVDRLMRDYLYSNVLASTDIAQSRMDKYIVLTRDSQIDYKKSKLDKFLNWELPDSTLIKGYPSAARILNDPLFLKLCFESPTMKPSADKPSEYKVYRPQTLQDLGKKYPPFRKSFYKA